MTLSIFKKKNYFIKFNIKTHFSKRADPGFEGVGGGVDGACCFRRGRAVHGGAGWGDAGIERGIERQIVRSHSDQHRVRPHRLQQHQNSEVICS